MIEASLEGRLGNWLFQYAAARALALERSTGVVLDVSRYATWRDPLANRVQRALRFFRIEAAFSRAAGAGRAALEAFGLRERRREHAEERWGYDPRFHALPAAVRLRGYFQSPLYWRGHADAIRHELAPVDFPRDPGVQRLVCSIEESAAVALHVRRGDYLTHERTLHLVCTDAYYDAALRFVRDRVCGARVFVFSDDPAWCRARYGGDPSMTVVELEASTATAGLDLALMARCKHHVISNSTYSWWGAWLASHATQVVCAPARWFNDEAMNAAAMRDTVPAHWHRIALAPQPA